MKPFVRGPMSDEDFATYSIGKNEFPVSDPPAEDKEYYIEIPNINWAWVYHIKIYANGTAEVVDSDRYHMYDDNQSQHKFIGKEFTRASDLRMTSKFGSSGATREGTIPTDHMYLKLAEQPVMFYPLA